MSAKEERTKCRRPSFAPSTAHRPPARRPRLPPDLRSRSITGSCWHMPPPTRTTFHSPYKDVSLRASARRRVIDQAHQLLDRIAQALPDVASEKRVLMGPPVEQLLSTCRGEGAELLVLGSSRRRLNRSATRGVATRVARLATCPVISLAARQRLRASSRTNQGWVHRLRVRRLAGIATRPSSRRRTGRPPRARTPHELPRCRTVGSAWRGR
jgi:nucleotide-binding universal stress UspA family protein